VNDRSRLEQLIRDAVEEGRRLALRDDEILDEVEVVLWPRKGGRPDLYAYAPKLGDK
jgi:hypothetical protein